MKLECLKSFAGTKFSGVVGEVKNFPDDIAADLIRAGYAKEIKEKVESNESKRDNDDDDRPAAKRGRKRTIAE